MTTLLALYAVLLTAYARALYRSRRRLRRALDYERQVVTRLISTPEPAPPDAIPLSVLRANVDWVYSQYPAWSPKRWWRAEIGTDAGLDSRQLCEWAPAKKPSIRALQMVPPEADELRFGNYAPRRFAWECAYPYRYAAPIPYRGLQGLFNVPLSVITRTEVFG